MMNYNKTQEQTINDYLAECIKNNYHCQHCAKNDNGICFFAFPCFMNDMAHFDDREEDDEKEDNVNHVNKENNPINERTRYRLREFDGTEHYIMLTPEQERFMNWNYGNAISYDGIDIDIIKDIEWETP